MFFLRKRVNFAISKKIMKKKYYVVWNGVMPGIYESWSECQAQIKGYVGALYKSFGSRQEAEQAMCRPAYSYIGKKSKQKTGDRVKGSYIKKSIAVDAACSGNPGVLEYRGVNVETGELIFHVGTFPQGTNNIGEFLALVHALAMLKQAGSSLPVYSDSHNAIV
jgi:ribonuclease HI